MDNFKLTWKPDLPDFRDYQFSKYTSVLKTGLPSKVDMRTRFPLVYDQGNLGSCTSNCISTAIDFERLKQNIQPLLPSRLFIYYNERLLENTVSYDSGASLRDGIKTVSKDGACAETEWPYDISKFTIRPATSCYTNAQKNLVKQYLRLNNTNITELKTCLAAGYGFVFGFTVYQSFMTTNVIKTGMVPMPNTSERVLGGHATFCLGYDDSKSRFIVRNSWGTGWGDKGHFYIPYSYLTNQNLAGDFWSIQLV